MLGILCIWIRGWFWLAPVVAQTVFLLGAGYVHVQDILIHDNFAPGNAGTILFYDIVVPAIGCGLFYAHFRMGGIGDSKDVGARSPHGISGFNLNLLIIKVKMAERTSHELGR